jgi:urease accessory protein
MLTITERYDGPEFASDRLVLPFDLRKKSRLRVTLASGVEAGLVLERGHILRGGDKLRASDGCIVVVDAAPERVMLVRAPTQRLLNQAAYHLGNRHVPLQVGGKWLLLEADHVLEDMLRGLGVSVTHELAPFEPEAGAYGGGHRHDADNDDDHHHGHSHHSHSHHHAHSHGRRHNGHAHD